MLYLSLPAHIVHQKVGIAFAPNESHNCLLFGPGESRHYLQVSRSVWPVHYVVNGTMRWCFQSCFELVITNEDSFEEWPGLETKALRRRVVKCA